MNNLKLTTKVDPSYFSNDLLSSGLIYVGEDHREGTIHWENQRKIVEKIMASRRKFQVAYENFPSNIQRLFNEPVRMEALSSYIERNYREAIEIMTSLIMTSLAYPSQGIIAMGKPSIMGFDDSIGQMNDHMAAILRPKLSLDVLTLAFFGDSHLQGPDTIQRRFDLNGTKETIIMQEKASNGNPGGIYMLNQVSPKDPKYVIRGSLSLS